jgi:hypothetical protein
LGGLEELAYIVYLSFFFGDGAEDVKNCNNEIFVLFELILGFVLFELILRLVLFELILGYSLIKEVTTGRVLR